MSQDFQAALWELERGVRELQIELELSKKALVAITKQSSQAANVLSFTSIDGITLACDPFYYTVQGYGCGGVSVILGGAWAVFYNQTTQQKTTVISGSDGVISYCASDGDYVSITFSAAYHADESLSGAWPLVSGTIILGFPSTAICWPGCDGPVFAPLKIIDDNGTWTSSGTSGSFSFFGSGFGHTVNQDGTNNLHGRFTYTISVYSYDIAFGAATSSDGTVLDGITVTNPGSGYIPGSSPTAHIPLKFGGNPNGGIPGYSVYCDPPVNNNPPFCRTPTGHAIIDSGGHVTSFVLDTVGSYKLDGTSTYYPGNPTGLNIGVNASPAKTMVATFFWYQFGSYPAEAGSDMYYATPYSFRIYPTTTCSPFKAIYALPAASDVLFPASPTRLAKIIGS